MVISRDHKPWTLVEAKKADEKPSPSLACLQRQTKAPFAFQVVLDAARFARPGGPRVVPTGTLLSQLL
jgi:hypothetical protein